MCQGDYTSSSVGFVLQFSMGADKFIVEHCGSETKLVAEGVMSYDIILSDSPTFTLLKTPYGVIEFSVKTTERDVSCDDGGVRLVLGFILSAKVLGEIVRVVNIDARFLHKEVQI